MTEPKLTITPVIPIPAFMAGEVQSKLAYVDEKIERASVQPDGSMIHVILKSPVGEVESEKITLKVQDVVTVMVKGVIQPKAQILENHPGSAGARQSRSHA